MDNLQIDQLPREETLVRLLELGQRYGLTTARRLADAQAGNYWDGAWDVAALGPCAPLSAASRAHFRGLAEQRSSGLR